MRKITLVFLSIMLSMVAWSQSIVDTIPLNKKAILEEFTGIHCTFCPDGHKISEQLATANPNDFFAINIHVGSYATPSAGEPDFRTPFGTAIANQSGLTGYPAGTVNRHLFAGMSQGTGTAQSRGNWASTSTTIRNTTSYVNIASEASINLATRELTVLVEGYFTDTLAPASMKLNVALLQNNVEGPQVGMTANPAQVLPNGKYNHMHMLRHMITGQWGEAIDTTSKGTFFSRTYVYTIPAVYTGVAVGIADIEIVAFIAEGNQEIITGNKAVMDYITPPGVFNVDLKATNTTVLPELCGTSITPKVLITNSSSTINADTFNVEYSFNGGTPVSQLFTVALNAGDTITVSFPVVNITSKVNDIVFTVDVDDAIHLMDIAAANNIAVSPKFYNMPAATIGTIYSEGFESYSELAAEIDNTIILNAGNSPAYAISKASVTGLTQDIGGFAASSKSYFVNFYNIAAGEEVEMMFQKMDFSGNTQYGLKFNYAYAQYQAENDRLQILVSDNCGATWTSVWNKAGSALATAPALGSSNFFPTATQWKAENIDLSAYNGKSDVIIKFKATSDYGNNLLFDDINIYNNTNVGIETSVAENTINIYPNPAIDNTEIEINLAKNAKVSFQIFNAMGQIIESINLGDRTAGQHIENVDLSNLAQGIYSINLTIDGQVITKKLVVR